MTADGHGDGSPDDAVCSRPSRPADASVPCDQTRGIGESTANTIDEESAMTPPHDTPKLAQTQHFCYEPPISRNQLIGKGFQRCHVF
jgi:hypothetical protein